MPAVISPILAGLIAALGVFLVYRIIKRFVVERAERQFRWAQVASSSWSRSRTGPTTRRRQWA